jgi:hypothetical protein
MHGIDKAGLNNAHATTWPKFAMTAKVVKATEARAVDEGED